MKATDVTWPDNGTNGQEGRVDLELGPNDGPGRRVVAVAAGGDRFTVEGVYPEGDEVVIALGRQTSDGSLRVRETPEELRALAEEIRRRAYLSGASGERFANIARAASILGDVARYLERQGPAA